MKKLLLLSFILLLAAPAIAIEFTTWSSGNAFVYPLDEKADIFVSIKKGILDDVEDVKYTISLSGPAAFLDGTTIKTGEILELEKSIAENHTINLKYTPSLKGEDVVVSFTGTYVSNSIVLGGKKNFNASSSFTVLARDIGSDEQIPKEEEKTPVKTTSDVQLKDDIFELQKENAELKTKLGDIEAKLESKSAILGNIIFWTILIVLMLVVGAIGYYYFKKKFFKHKKKFREEDY